MVRWVAVVLLASVLLGGGCAVRLPPHGELAAMLPEETDGICVARLKDPGEPRGFSGEMAGAVFGDPSSGIFGYYRWLVRPQEGGDTKQLWLGWGVMGTRTPSSLPKVGSQCECFGTRPVLVFRADEPVFALEPNSDNDECRVSRVGEIGAIGIFAFDRKAPDEIDVHAEKAYISIIDRRIVVVALEREDLEEALRRARAPSPRLPARLSKIGSVIPDDADFYVLRANSGLRADGSKGLSLLARPLTIEGAMALAHRASEGPAFRYFVEPGHDRDAAAIMDAVSGQMRTTAIGGDSEPMQTCTLEGEGLKQNVFWQFNLDAIRRHPGWGEGFGMMTVYLTWQLLSGLQPEPFGPERDGGSG